MNFYFILDQDRCYEKNIEINHELNSSNKTIIKIIIYRFILIQNLKLLNIIACYIKLVFVYCVGLRSMLFSVLEPGPGGPKRP